MLVSARTSRPRIVATAVLVGLSYLVGRRTGLVDGQVIGMGHATRAYAAGVKTVFAGVR